MTETTEPLLPHVQAYAGRLLIAASDGGELERAYADYIRAVLDSPLWLPQHTDALRVPWRSAREASNHPLFRDAFDSPGLYLFGSGKGVPLYLGMTASILRKRLFRRYVSGKRSQCQLAADHEAALVTRGIDGFPEDIRAWYRRSFKGSTVRLQGAVAFARVGIEGIWFTVIPIENPDAVRQLERSLIPIAVAWNVSHGYPPLINVEDTES